MASAAAVTSGKRRREALDRARQMELQRHRLSHRRQVLQKRACQVFDQMADKRSDNDDSELLLLPESQMNEFLQLVLQTKHLHPDAVQLVIDTAHRNQAINTTLQQERAKGINRNKDEQALSKEALVSAVTAYGQYVSQTKTIDQVFLKFDKDHNGTLSRQELRQVLQEHERKANRTNQQLIVTHLVVTEEDLDWILDPSDADGTGTISHAEYLPALAAWEELAQAKIQTQHESLSCCIIL